MNGRGGSYPALGAEILFARVHLDRGRLVVRMPVNGDNVGYRPQQCWWCAGIYRTEPKSRCRGARGEMEDYDTTESPSVIHSAPEFLLCMQIIPPQTIYTYIADGSPWRLPDASCTRLTAPRYDFDKTDDDSERPWVWDQAFSSLDHTMRSWPGVGR